MFFDFGKIVVYIFIIIILQVQREQNILIIAIPT